MARLWTCGFELGSATSGMEVSSVSGSPTVGTVAGGFQVRSGTYSGRINGLTSGVRKAFDTQYQAANSDGPVYGRAFYYFVTLPTAETSIMSWTSSTGVTVAWVAVDNSGNILLRDEDGLIITIPFGAGLAGFGWLGIEMALLRNGGVNSTAAVRFIDGVTGSESAVIAASNRAHSVGYFSFNVGGNLRAEALTHAGADWYIDDCAVNDGTGERYENFWPGDGRIVHLYPDSDGDMGNAGSQGTDWESAPTAGQAAYLQVDETPTPDDATSYLRSLTASTGIADAPILDFNVQAASTVPNNAVIKVVHVGARINDAGSGASAHVYRLKSGSAETPLESAGIAHSSTVWTTHQVTAPKTYRVTSYYNPSVTDQPWTPVMLNTMQIGWRNNNDVAPVAWCSSLWAAVEYTTSQYFPPYLPKVNSRTNVLLRR